MWVRDVQSCALCNHFYFPLLAALPSDLDCISRGRQRQNKGMLVMRARLPLGGTDGRTAALVVVEGVLIKGTDRSQVPSIRLLINVVSFTKSYKLTEQCRCTDCKHPLIRQGRPAPRTPPNFTDSLLIS